MIIGGGAIYQQTIDRTDRLYMTHIGAHLVGDTHFPDINLEEWEEVSRSEHAADGDNPFDLTFVVLDRKQKE